MSASVQKSAPRVAAIRLKRQEAGFYETTDFVHKQAREGIDRAIAEGRFKSRSEAMEAVNPRGIHARGMRNEAALTTEKQKAPALAS